jgi:hypothetical protein
MSARRQKYKVQLQFLKLPSARWRDIVLTSQESAPKRNIINYHTDENRATLAWLLQKILCNIAFKYLWRPVPFLCGTAYARQGSQFRALLCTFGPVPPTS